MRRRGGGFRGVIEFLIASAAQSCRDEGAEFLSLSGAPARLDLGEQLGGLQRLLDFAGRAGAGVSAAVRGLSRPGRATEHRQRHRSRLPAAPHHPAGCPARPQTAPLTLRHRQTGNYEP